MSHRLAAAAVVTAIAGLVMGFGELRAQTAKPVGSASAETALRDLETDPPTKLGTKLDVEGDWDEQPRVVILRERLDPLEFTDPFLSRKGCDIRVMDDWLKVRCPGRAARVHQLAGDPKESVVHISHRRQRHPKGHIIDDSRMLLFVRLEPGKAKVFEVTHVAPGYDSDGESNSGLLSVDWTDPDRGPRVSLSRTNGWW